MLSYLFLELKTSVEREQSNSFGVGYIEIPTFEMEILYGSREALDQPCLFLNHDLFFTELGFLLRM